MESGKGGAVEDNSYWSEGRKRRRLFDGYSLCFRMGFVFLGARKDWKRERW